MIGKLKIAFFGSSLVSAYWNGAATYYRGILKELAGRGFAVTFFEPDAYERQRHRDIEDPPYADVRVYDATERAATEALDEAESADIVIKASGVGVFDRLLEEEVLRYRDAGKTVVFWDVDAPATLERIASDPDDYFRALVPEYDLILTYGGGKPVVSAYEALGARGCIPVYNALDPETHHPVPSDPRFKADLGFLGNRMPDREERVREFFFSAAFSTPDKRFVLGGNGWDRFVPDHPNIRYLGHVYTADHNVFNCSASMVLNVSRAGMARYGFSPATRVFEAAGAGACVITDAWEGIGMFLSPGVECLVAESGRDVSRYLRTVTPEEARRIGDAARIRILAEHTYSRRAEMLAPVFRDRHTLPGRAV